MKPWVFWSAVGIILFVVEMLTPGMFFFSCFAVSALVAALLAFLGVPAWIVWIAFFGLSILLLVVARPLAARMTQGESRPSNVEALIGKTALVTEPIAPHRAGVVKVEGELWRAEASEEVPAGSLVQILKVEGTRVIVKRQSA